MHRRSWKGKIMLGPLIGFLNLLLAGLLTGAMFGVFLLFRPKGQAGPPCLQLHRRGVRTLDPAMPALGAATVAVTVLAAAMSRHDGARLGLLATAGLGFVAAGLVTRFRNQRINAIVMSWPDAAPPPEWAQLRDRWWRWHVTRLAFGVAGLCALILAGMADPRPAATDQADPSSALHQFGEVLKLKGCMRLA